MTDTIYNTPDFGFEELIARHCGPALAGIKLANLVSVSKAKIDNIDEKMTVLNAKLNRKDIYLEIICECDKTAVILVYKRKLLTEYLNRPEILELLKKFGYKKCDDVSGYISQLKRRMSGEGLIVNESPDDDALEQCKKFGSNAANA